ncbi:MAG: ADP-ribosylglycohydrolase family protein, partial [Aedoeadaptatus pacaensis]
MDKLKSAIYGLAVGDALGVPFEFRERGTFRCEGMTGYGTWNRAPGTWSDDTSMTLATLDSIKEKKCID